MYLAVKDIACFDAFPAAKFGMKSSAFEAAHFQKALIAY
jgi:hypothetical protein